MNQLFPFINARYSSQLSTEAGGGSLLVKLLEMCIRMADNDPNNAPQVRIAALGLLTEIWLAYPTYIQNNELLSNPIQHVFKKNARDRIRSVRI